MVQLQESLIGLGIAVVAGVIGYNKWQEWRAKKSVEQAFSTAQDDVLMADGQASAHRHEPVLSPFEGPDVVLGHAPAVTDADAGYANQPTATLPPASDAATARHPAVSSSAPTSAPSSATSSASPARRSPLDPAIDCKLSPTLHSILNIHLLAH